MYGNGFVAFMMTRKTHMSCAAARGAILRLTAGAHTATSASLVAGASVWVFVAPGLLRFDLLAFYPLSPKAIEKFKPDS